MVEACKTVLIVSCLNRVPVSARVCCKHAVLSATCVARDFYLKNPTPKSVLSLSVCHERSVFARARGFYLKNPTPIGKPLRHQEPPLEFLLSCRFAGFPRCVLQRICPAKHADPRRGCQSRRDGPVVAPRQVGSVSALCVCSLACAWEEAAAAGASPSACSHLRHAEALGRCSYSCAVVQASQ